MDRIFVRKDVYEELLEKGFGKRDMSKLTKKKITDKNGHTRTVYVKNGEQPATQQQPKGQDELSPEKKARYEEMLEQVKAGPEENALFVRGKGMLNKKDAIAHLSAKLGTKTVNSASQGHLESDTPQNTDITKEDEERFGKQALSGLSGRRTAEPKHTLEVGSEVKFKRTGQPIKIKKIEQYGDTKVVVGEYDYKGKKEENRFRLDELDYEEKKPEQKKEDNPITIGNTVKYKRTGQPIKIKDIETYGNDKVIVGEYEHNGKTETNRFRMDEISTEPTQNGMKTEKKSSKELKKEIEDLRSEYREKYDSLSAKEKNEYVKKFDELEAEIDKTETEETGMNKFERRGYEGTIENQWLDKTKLPQIKENAEAKIRGYENLLKELKNDKSKKNSVQRESYEVNLAIAQDNLDEWKGKLKAINEMMEKASKKNTSETKDSVNGFTLDDISHIGDGKTREQTKFINDMETAKGVVEMIARKYGATKKGREQLMDFIALNIGGTNPLYDKLYEEYGVDADDLDMDFEASHDLILNQAMGKNTKKNREQIADSKSDFERRYRQMLEREG